MKEKVYGSTYTQGYEVYDSVCILDEPDACLPRFKWFASNYVEGMDDIYGIIGMATGFHSGSGPNMIMSLYEGGVISEPVFGWYLSDMSDESYVDIGFLSAESIREGEELVWLPVVEDDFWWTNFVTAIKFDDEEFALSTAYAMTDTGTSCAYVPSSLYFYITDKVLTNVSDVEVDFWGDVYFDCD